MAVIKDINAPKPKEVKDVTTQNSGEKSFVEKVAEARAKALEIKAVEEVFGAGKDKGGTDLQTSIVTAAMGQQDILLKALQAQIGEANKQLALAQAEREKAQTNLYNERITLLKAEQQKLDQTAEAAHGAGAPKSQLEVYKEVRLALQEEIGELKKDAPKPSGPQGMSEETMITLKKLEMDQGRVLAQIQADAEQRAQTFQLELRKFDEDAKRRWAEYRDNKELREQGISGAQDLFAAIGDGITRERGGAPAGGPRAAERKGGGEEVKAFIKRFPCSQCQEMVKIQPGSTTAVCEGCGTEYDIQVTE